MATSRPIRAAGAVVWRHGSTEPEVMLIHRPRYDDWSLPKGKLDPGESTPVAAVREVAEETGVRVRLGAPLPDQHYTVGGTGGPQPKLVAYWAAQAPPNTDLSRFEANAEVDDLRWTRLSKARQRLTYPRDAKLLEALGNGELDSIPLVIVRHAQARSRKSWRGDDAERPLRAVGHRQSAGLVSLLAAYGVGRVVTSDALRCVDTILPYLNAADAGVTLEPRVSEETTDPQFVTRRMRRALKGRLRVALCSHRLVLPQIFGGLGIEPIAMAPADVVVVHRHNGRISAVEHHPNLITR